MKNKQLQEVLKNRSTTFLRTNFEIYCKQTGLEKWVYDKTPKKWYFAQYDCKRRLRAECRLYDGEHELTITMRKKAGYYLLIEYDRRRIFECEPEIIVLDQDALNAVIEKYKELFDMIIN